MNDTPRSGRGRAARAVRTGSFVALAGMLVLLAACDADRVVLGTGGSGATLRSGPYEYDAWSSRHRDLAWWGTIDLRVHADGVITGTYRLPRQCSDRVGPGVDCYGRVGGRVYRDGTVRFGLDEGWLSHDGYVSRRSLVRGSWWTRLLGRTDDGTFELRAY
jgi:hypothetical protein